VRHSKGGKDVAEEEPMKRSAIASYFDRAGLHALLLALLLDGSRRAGLLQDLCDRCHEFIQLIEGQPPQPTYALDLLRVLPAGKSVADKFVIGLSRDPDSLVGVLDVIGDYPEPAAWYVGLLLFAPEEQGRGLGQRVYEALEQGVISQGGRSLRLIVQAQNGRALAFWRRVGFEVAGTSTQVLATRTNTIYHLLRRLPTPRTMSI
jgi:ribosomal protein S18 acetylase RimI-like enzyme